MAIDFDREKALSLSEAARAVPAINGRRPHTSTVWRWCRRGLHGIRLEYARFGHRIVTSAEAFARFSVALAEADALRQIEQPIPTVPKTSTTRQRERRAAATHATLVSAGIK